VTKIQELYVEANQLMAKAKDQLENSGQLTDAQKIQIDAWISQAEEIEKRATALEKVLEKEIELGAAAKRSEDELARVRTDARDRSTDFKSFSEFMLAIYNLRANGRYDARLDKMEQKDMAGEAGIYGGFLVPAALQQDILTARAEASFVRSRARIVPMSSRIVPFPALDYSGGTTAVSAFFGGVRVYYVEENVAITESTAKFKQIELHARELAGYTEIPNGLLRDSAISLEAFLKGPGSFGGALGWQEDYDCLRGNGAGRPLGILNAPGKVTVTRNAATDFKFVDAVSMKAKMLMVGKPVWVINQSVLPKLYQMVDAASMNIWLPNAAGAAPDTLLGYPIYWTEKTPALGTAGDVMLVDFAFYLLGDRQTITMDVDSSFKFSSNQTAFRAVEAYDGQPWLGTYITLADGATTVSPYVTLT
jgi:HK97 family phage major capsid protein